MLLLLLWKYNRSNEYRYKQGTTAVLETRERRFEIVSESVSRAEAMES